MVLGSIKFKHMKKYLLSTAIIALTFSSDLLGMDGNSSNVVKKTNSDHESLLRHIAVVRDLKKRSLHEETKKLDQIWEPLFQGKSLDQLKEYISNTVTGRILISRSQSLNKPIDDVLKNLILNSVTSATFSKDPSLGDRTYNIIANCIKNEIMYSNDYYVFYNSVKDKIRFTFDVITEFSNYFLIDPSHELLKLRFAGEEIPDYFKSMEDYMRTFYMPGPKGGGSGSDHSPFARKTQISANFSPLSNINKSGESTLAYFLYSENESDPSMDILRTILTFYLKDQTLVEERIQKYIALYDETIASKSGASLMQIFIKKDKVDSLVYLSQEMGAPYVKYPSLGLVPIKRDYKWKLGSIENFIPLEERINICSTIVEDIYSKLDNNQQNAKENLKKVEVELKDFAKYDHESPDPLGDLMTTLAATLKNDLHPHNLNDDMNPFIIYKNKLESHNSTTLFPVSEFLSNNYSIKDTFNPYNTQARILMLPNFINPDIVKVKIMTSNDIQSKDLALYREKLAALVLEDVSYYLEHTPKHEFQGSKLGVIKGYMEEGKKIERPSPPTRSSQGYDDPEFKGLGRVVPNKEIK